ncbi:MAG: hypothetical protein WBR29_01860 [Gammaproteobacteria bacterium]
MTIRTWLLGFATLLTIICLSLPFLPHAALPFSTNESAQFNSMLIQPIPGGVLLPPGLKAGDQLALADMTPGDRLAFLGASTFPVGTKLDLRVRRAGELHDIKLSLETTGFFNGDATSIMSQAATYIVDLLMCALMLLLLWRGRSLAACGIALWCFGNVLTVCFSSLPLPRPFNGELALMGNILDYFIGIIGLYLAAIGLTQGVHSPGTERRIHYAFASLFSVYLLCVLYAWFRLIQGGVFDVVYTSGLIIGLHMALYVFSVGVLLASYRHAQAVNRARIRWVLFSFLGVCLAYALQYILISLGAAILLINLEFSLFTAAAFLGFAYSVLRHRLVPLQFVLNRALVYGLVTTLVVGVFAALLSFLERAALNTETNRLLALLAPLLLGMGLNSIKRQVDDRINKMFFRRRRRAEAALTQFARTSGYMDDPEVLLDQLTDELFQNSGAQGLALYLVPEGKAEARQVRVHGNIDFPAKLSTHDRLVLRLKAGDAEVDLRTTQSKLGREGYAHALTVRGQIFGFVVIGPRPAEAYTPEERRLYAHAIQQAAVALHSLRLQDEHHLLQQLALGTFKSLSAARARACALLGRSSEPERNARFVSGLDA